jgi:NADPH2:quinone reductase
MAKTMAVVIHEKGEPDVFRWEEIELGAPGPGHVRLKNNAVGVNFVDTYHRRGTPHPWPVPPLPLVLGFEGAAEVQEVGPGVSEFKAGDRVAYAMPPHGAYSQERIYPADMLCRIPDGIDDATIASSMLKGLTAQYLLRRTYRVQPGDFVLIHAAAGGMGHVLCPWAKHLGATVIGTVSTAEKAEIARGLGCDYTINYSEEDFLPICRDITSGEGVHVVYESIGKDTLQRSLECLRHVRRLRARVGRSRSGTHNRGSRAARIAVSHPPGNYALHGETRGSGGGGRGTVRRDRQGRRRDFRSPQFSLARSGRGPCRY